MEESEKAAAGHAALQEVHSGMALGLGTGSTVYFFLEALGRRIKEEGLSVVGIPTSNQTADLARRFGIPLTSFEERQTLDLAVDGADEVDPQLRLIKGQGGALLREKIIAQSAKRRVYVVDSGKLSSKLGTHFPLPVEVIPFAWKVAERGLRGLGCEPTLRRGHGHADPEWAEPYKTDNGNYILDCRFSSGDPAALEEAINNVPGVVENGLFIGLTDAVIVAHDTGIEKLIPPPR